MILVIGSTGMVGYEICRLLSERGKETMAMVRENSNPEKVKGLKELGIKIFRGDVRDPLSYKEQLKGINTVITTISSMPFSYIPGENDIQTIDRTGMKKLIDSSIEAGTNHFIYTSFSGNIDIDFPLQNAKRDVERHLIESGINYTILRPSYFSEVWLSSAVGFDFPNKKVQIFGDGRKPISYISFLDVAKFAVESIDNSTVLNQTLELGGPNKISQLEAVQIFEEIHGSKFDIQFIPIETLKAQRAESHDPMEKSFSGLMENLALGDPIDMTENLSRFKISLNSVKNIAESMLTEH
jgi:uncharacterized protein YbjT (DUF2867 family)